MLMIVARNRLAAFFSLGFCLCVSVCSSLHLVRFGQLSCCVDKRIVNKMKTYIERNNMKVELIRFRKKM